MGEIADRLTAIEARLDALGSGRPEQHT